MYAGSRRRSLWTKRRIELTRRSPACRIRWRLLALVASRGGRVKLKPESKIKTHCLARVKRFVSPSRIWQGVYMGKDESFTWGKTRILHVVRSFLCLDWHIITINALPTGYAEWECLRIDTIAVPVTKYSLKQMLTLFREHTNWLPRFGTWPNGGMV